jgi:hypothetical protein
MNNHCDNAREALIDLEDAIAKRKKIREALCCHLPFQDQCTEDKWAQLSARCWVYATPHPEEYLEQVESGPQAPPNLLKAQSKASVLVDRWFEHVRENGDYFEFSEDDLPKPEEKELLFEYITRLGEMNVAGDLTSKPKHRALHCFLHFLRQGHTDEEIAFLEQILPVKHDIHHGVIRRLIHPQERPLSVEIVGAILENLAQRGIRGRPNARQNCLEALILCWMCLGIAKLRLPAQIEDLHATPISGLHQSNHILKLHTLFGSQPITLTEHSYRCISEMVARSQASGSGMILQGKLSVLRRSFADVVHTVDPTGRLGKITSRSFLTLPHYAGRWRR